MTFPLLALLLGAAAGAPLFPAIDGWTLEGPTRYAPEALFEAIDGAADTFLLFDVEELQAATYVGADRLQVSVDVYRHRDAGRAFGMYTQERPASYEPLPVGIEGYAGPDHLEFVAGRYYVKLSQSRRGEATLRRIAERIAAGLPGTRDPPPVLRCFPAKGKRARAERLTARDFLGQGFLHDGAAAPYELGGARFRLFAIEGRDGADAQQMARRYLAAARAPAEAGPEGSATLQDPLNGEVQLRWRGRWLWGAVDAWSPERAALVEELGKNLAALPGEPSPR